MADPRFTNPGAWGTVEPRKPEIVIETTRSTGPNPNVVFVLPRPIGRRTMRLVLEPETSDKVLRVHPEQWSELEEAYMPEAPRLDGGYIRMRIMDWEIISDPYVPKGKYRLGREDQQRLGDVFKRGATEVILNAARLCARAPDWSAQALLKGIQRLGASWSGDL